MPPANNIFSRVFSGNSKAQNIQQQNSDASGDGKRPVASGGSSTQQGNEIEGLQDPNNGQNKGAKKSATPQSPLDDFSTLFDAPDPNDPNKEALPPSLSISADKLKGHVDKLDFTKDLPEEALQGIANMGDQGKLILSLLNHVGRQAYSTAVQHNSAITDRFVGQRSEFDSKSLQNRVKSELVRSGFHKSNSHPVVKAAQEMLAAQLQAKNPDATPDWIQEKTNSFFQLLGQQLAPQKQGGRGEGGAEGEEGDGDVNWLEFVGQKEKPDNSKVA